MGQRTVTHSCGHEQVHNLFGKNTDRDSRVTWLSGGLCRDCYRAEEQAKLLAAAAKLDLPALTGSEKQVAWATKLRHAAITTKAPASDKDAHGWARLMNLVSAHYPAATTSRWWIDEGQFYTVWMLRRYGEVPGTPDTRRFEQFFDALSADPLYADALAMWRDDDA